jgi:hypothetical protein
MAKHQFCGRTQFVRDGIVPAELGHPKRGLHRVFHVCRVKPISRVHAGEDRCSGRNINRTDKNFLSLDPIQPGGRNHPVLRWPEA